MLTWVCHLDTHTHKIFFYYYYYYFGTSGFCELMGDGGGHEHQPHFSGGS